MIISLGNGCGIAYQLEKANLRNCAFPFDWTRTPSFSKVNTIISNNFEDFTTVKLGNVTTSFPYLETDNFTFNNIETITATNKYGVKFFHDIKSKRTSNDIEEFKEKYDRRIRRFYETIKNNKVHFIRDEAKCYPNLKKDIIDFTNIISKFCDNYILSVIIANSSNSQISIDIPNAEIIYDTKDYEDWRRPNVDWATIFAKK